MLHSEAGLSAAFCADWYLSASRVHGSNVTVTLHGKSRLYVPVHECGFILVLQELGREFIKTLKVSSYSC